MIYNKPHNSDTCWCKICKNWLGQKCDIAVQLAKDTYPNATDDEIEDEAVRILHEARSKCFES